jgi:hypothetical protein
MSIFLLRPELRNLWPASISHAADFARHDIDIK